MKKETFFTAVLSAAMILLLAACSGGGPVKFDAPAGAPYAELNMVDKMNSSCSYSYKKGVNVFSVKMQWRTKDETVDHAEFTDEYYLEWSTEANAFYRLCEPDKDMSALRAVTYSIKPGEDVTFSPDVDSYFDGLPKGYYRIIKVLDVIRKDGSSEKMVANFDFDMSN